MVGDAAGHGYRRATHQELSFLVEAGALGRAPSGLLISVDAAISACDRARVAAPVLAALAGVPELQPYTPSLP